MRTHGRWRRLVLTAAAIAVLGAGLSAPALAESSTQDFDECYSISNLQVSPVKQNQKSGRHVRLTWDEPECGGVWDDYRVIMTDDYRPQRSIEFVTGTEGASARKLKAGRLYTFRVQVGSEGEFDQEPLEVSVRIPGNSTDAWVVSVGDSFISGEGGRWAGNTDFLPNARAETDTGERSYFDDEDGETIAGCHRSNAALIHIGVARSMNFACSGAITTSAVDKGYWKPGIDRVIRNDVDLGEFGPAIGQAEMLKRFAETHRVEMVVLSIGGNNFYFSDIVETCVKNFLGTGNCSDSERLDGYVSETWQDRVRAEVKTAIQEIVWAMRAAGYEESQWTLVQNLYPAPIARSQDMRYEESNLLIPFYRQARGGCGMRDVDADWAVGTVLPTINDTVMEAAVQAKIWAPELRVVHMDNSRAFAGHELCNKAVFRVNSANAEDRKGVRDWRRPGASDKSEWMKEIDISNLSAAEKNESFHPGYWGQLGLRNCLRKLWNGGNIVSGGRCEPALGLNVYGEPNMKFQDDTTLSLLR